MMWFFIFCGFIACAGLQVHATCPVVMKPPAVVVAFGGPLSVNCTSLSSETDGMGWESPAGGTNLRTGVTSVPLNIKSIQVWNLEPTCYINFIDGSQCTNNLPITVYKLPDTVAVSQPSPAGSMVEGNEYVMQCDIINVAPAGNLSVQWYKGNKMFHMEKFDGTSPTPVNKTSAFRLTAQRDDIGAQIWCEATLNFFPVAPNILSVSKKIDVATVLFPPTFTNPENETVEVTSETELLLNCTASGIPAPVYSWHYTHPSQQSNTNGNEHWDENKPVFAPSVHLPGTYSCTASNSQGTSTKYFNVIEQPRSLTTLAAIIGAFVGLGLLLLIAGFFIVTPNGSFSLNKGNYAGGQPVPSGPV